MFPRHPRTPLRLACLALALLAFAAPPARAASGRLGPALARRLRTDPSGPVVAWVFFTDRAGAEREPAANARLSARALERRVRRGTLATPVASDLPVHEPYVRALTARGARLRGTSRWLDAASVEIPGSLVAEIARLPFVDHLELVPTGRPLRPVPEPGSGEIAIPVETPAAGPARAGQVKLAPGQQAYYGGAYRQLNMMQVPTLHTQGLSGAGVLVCMLDGGFHTTHQAFAGLDIVAKRDFVYGDTIVDDEPGQDSPGNADHGSWTLGCVAGNLPGSYAGGAFLASVALGKTENGSSETPVEMDYWQFGAEWADSLGADVISSSLGYSEFDNPADSYTYADMNGQTTVVTLAALEAARRGITVVNAAGNEGAIAWHYIIAPADADSMVAVGAVDSNNVITSFSSRGPTSDGRTKPDVTAMGRSVLLVSTTNNLGYVRASGTSFAAPLTAGVAALILQAHPSWGPFEVREALRGSALNSASPNNNIGWGLVQGVGAVNWVPSTAGVASNGGAAGLRLSVGPSPLRAGAGGTIRFAVPPGQRARLDVLDTAGRRVAAPFDGVAGEERSVTWSARDASGAPVPAGIYWVRLAAGAWVRSAQVVVLP
jgi:subtilisin family serine protease